MWRTTIRATVLIALAVAAPATARAQASSLPIFDAHVHYNLDIGRPVPVETVFDLWRRAGIRGVLLTSRPNDGTRELLAASPPEFQAVAFARPYIVASDVRTWFRDPAILVMIEKELARGIYKGIGEFHIFGHDADSEGFARFVALASQHRLWLHVHCDDYVIERIFAFDPDARVIWAHTGMSTPPARVDELLGRHSRLYGELSYRSGIVDGDALSPAWRALFTKYPQRFLLGSDTWVPERWPEVPAIMQSYRAWLSQLPPDIAEKIAWRNGATLFLGQ
jgi:hypothetical protein